VAGFERNYVGDGMNGVAAERIYRTYVGGKIGVSEAAVEGGG
jgi:hypothetical protein